jgi:ankyrin repeat protein
MRACLWAQVEVVQLLLVHGATPDVPARTTGSTALMFACMHGPNRPPPPQGVYDAFRYKMTVESLLANGANPAIGNAKGETARVWARQSGATDLVAEMRDD